MENREQTRRAVGDTGIDRRDFLKGAAVSGAAALAAGALAGCAPQGGAELAVDDLAATGADGESEWGTFDESGKFTPSFLADPEPIPDDAIVEEFDAEIVVVGFGLTGLSAAREAMEEGFLAGYPMVDIKCTVFDGSYHSVDSNEMAFKTAARIGFRACCENAGPIILEPWATMEVTVGEEYAGTIMGDISTRRGRIVGTDAGFAAGETVIKMRAPYAEVINYTKDLRSMTRGSGSYTLTLEGYEQAPADVTKKLVEAYEAARAAGN